MSVTLVLGAGGGAGTTTTAVGLVNLLSLHGKSAVAVDATVGGGDLVDRAADAIVTPATVESGYIDAELSVTSTGAQVLGRAWPDTIEPDYGRLDWYLSCMADAAVYDFGHRAFERDSAGPLRSQPWAALVLVVPARPDAVRRSRTALHTIRLAAGEKALRRTTVVLSHTDPRPSAIGVDDVCRGLDSVFDVQEVPYDAHLASGSTVTASELATATTHAYERILASNIRSAWGTMSA
ncbi:hypothetical protein [Rhodococcoides kyotonense]|uniref:MinD-like ATPase involved in chromosome partitioning or flagellar assembly n=1 Tax=Rhodococcoides kyotonense TaxID=398843 RepID=A0A239I615_9NOCA|nr:hypothetical protein [Rhodococcus kyotonensis]SNS88931.1 MinD-like ATPase involved in chromosome partitioning or flagellar assembly [Rhodococcus kyotonensis]